MIRRYLSFLLSILLAFIPSLSEAKIDRHYTPASMTRDEFTRAEAKLMSMDSIQVISEAKVDFGLEFALNQIKDQYNKTSIAQKISFDEVSRFERSWIAALVLARLDFENPALMHLWHGLDVASEAAEFLIKSRGLTVEEVDQAYVTILALTTSEMLQTFGNLKSFERQRLGRFVRDATNILKSKALTEQIKDHAGNALADSSRWQSLMAWIGFPTGLVTSGVGVYSVLSDQFFHFTFGLGNWGAFVFVGAAFAALASGMVTGGLTAGATWKIGHARGARDTRYQTFRVVGEHCEKMLTEGGDVIP